MRLKRLLLASALALSFTVSAPTSAKADPVTASIVAWAGFTAGTTAAAVATFVVNSALYAAGSFAISKAASALGLTKQAAQQRQASVTTLTLGESPRELVIGQACVAGTLVDAFNFSGKYGTDKVTRCIALADHAVDSIVGYFVDDVYYPWTNNGLQSAFSNKLSIDFRNAGADGYDPPLHVRQNADWGFSDRLCGVTHVWVDHFYDEKVWTQGHPRLKFVLRGLKVYDPRYDPAFGYTGPNPQTWEDRSSHRFSSNAILCRYAYQRGIYAEGHHGEYEHLLFGRGLSAVEAPPERIIAWANLCDELVDGENRYTTNGVISTAQSHDEVEQLFAAAMAGTIVQREGGIEVEPGHAKAVVATITDDDLELGETLSYADFLPDTDGGRINTVLPRYVEPAQGYQDHGGPVLRDLADLAEDEGPRELTLTLALVTSVKQAGRVGEIARRKARLERRDAIVLPPRFAGIEEGDWIAWTSARRHGGATVRYRVTRFSLGADWRNRLALEEIASSVYGVADPVEDQATPPPAPVPVDALQLLGVTAEAITLAGETSTLPAVRFAWDVEVEDTSITGIRAEIRKAGATDAATTRLDDPAKGFDVVTNGVWPDSVLECRLVPLGDPTRPVLTSNWITVNTTAVTGGVSPEDPVWAELLKATKDLLQGNIDDAQALLEEEQNRDRSVGDVLDRIGLGFVLDPVERTALIKTETVAQGVGPGGVSETLVQMTTRLTAVDAVNAAATSQALIDAQAFATAAASSATIGLVGTAQLDASIAASALSLRDYVDAGLVSATADLVSAGDMAGAISESALSLQVTITGQINMAVADLVSTSALASSLATAKGQWESYATSAASGATVGLDSIAAREAALAAARGQWEAYATSAASGATVGLDSIAAREAALAAARGQWEAYADDAALSATVGLDTVVARDAAVAASALSLQSEIVNQVNTATATLASQTSLNGVLATASLALATANGDAGYAALSVDVANRLTAMRINGVDRAISFLADYFSVSPGGSDGIYFDGPAGRFKVVKGSKKVVLASGADVILWAGSTGVSDGAETYDNGDLGIGSTGAYFGGQTLSGPFDSGAGSSTEIALTTSYQTIATVPSKAAFAGDFAFWPEFWSYGAGQLINAEVGNYRLEIDWQVVSADQSNGDQEVLESGSWSRSQLGSSIFANGQYARNLTPGMSVAGTKSGNRKLLFQARRVYGSPVFVSLARLRGFYAA